MTAAPDTAAEPPRFPKSDAAYENTRALVERYVADPGARCMLLIAILDYGAVSYREACEQFGDRFGRSIERVFGAPAPLGE